jgi:ABC-2 type transport system permease protein
VSTQPIAEMSARPWLGLAAVHARWVLGTTWRNGEQILLLVGIPLAALLAITRTDLLSTSTPPVVITTVMVVLAAGFTSPAISLAFERRYGSFAFLGTTPLPRSAIIAGSLSAIALSSIMALAVLSIIAAALGEIAITDFATIALTAALGLAAVVPWAFVLGGTARSETVLVLANAVFVVATLFGGVLVPASSLPYGDFLSWFPTGAMVELATTPHIASVAVLVLWSGLGAALAVRTFRWR